MSAYGHQMESEYSSERLASHGSSGLISTERESGYAMESGFYMTSFAATIFIASLVTFKILLVMMIVALATMLQSCQNRSAGLIETHFRFHDHGDACKALAVHAELNKFEATRFPVICRDFAIRYIEDGQYERDLNSAASLVEKSIGSLDPRDDGLDVILLDVDDVLSPSPLFENLSLQRKHSCGGGDCKGVAMSLKHVAIVTAYAKLHAKGWPVILFSRKPEPQRDMMIETLRSSAIRDWCEDKTDGDDFESCFFRRREALQRDGFRVKGTISSSFDALTGPSLGGLVFKLPNHIPINSEDQSQSKVTPE